MIPIRKVFYLLKCVEVSLRRQIIQYTKCLFYMVIYTIASMIFPGIISLIIDKGIAVRNITYIIYYTFCFFLTGITIVFFQYLQRMGFAKFSQRLIVEMKNKIVEKIGNTNLEFWATHKIGDIYTIIESDIPKLESLLTTIISDAVVNLLVIMGTLGLLCYIDPLIGGMLFVVACLFAFLQKQEGEKVKKGMTEIREQVGKQASFTNEILNYIENIQITNSFNKVQQKYQEKNERIIEKQIYQTQVLSISKSLGMFYNVTSMLLVIIIGSFRTYNGTLTVGIFFSLILYAQNLYSPVVGLSNTYITVKNIAPLIDKILEIFQNDNVIKSGDYYPKENIKGNICFSHVFFSYEKDGKYHIKDLSFKLQSGKVLGIVGNNGCGKTTIIKLLSLLCIPQKGKIEIDDIPITKYNIDFLRNQIGYMLQNTYLPSGKLINVLFPNYEEEGKMRLNQIIIDFELNINKFPKGLESYIGENHSNLSGGESQKIALIRMFMEDKSVYILDEPTAAIDMKCEKKICFEIKKHLHGKSAIIITHRPAILEMCDEILCL